MKDEKRAKLDPTAFTTSLSSAEIVASALNEQGYLFHYRITQILQSPDVGIAPQHKWRVEAVEMPVSLPNGDETRIDIILRHGSQKDNPWNVVIECKRASPDFKRWIFFGKATNPNNTFWDSSYYMERANLAGSWNSQENPSLTHYVERITADEGCPLFEYAMEARLNRTEDKKKRISSTEAIETAFQQVALGQAGLVRKLITGKALNFRTIPVVITSAELVSAEFDVKQVSEHLYGYKIRTVYVVQAEHIHPFLAWLEKMFPNAQRL